MSLRPPGDPRPDRSVAEPDSSLTALTEWGARAPLYIAVYFVLGLALRLAISSNLEIDEASFVGATHWAWGYGDSQPPLYNWLVNLVLKATGYWPAIAAIKFGLLAALFLLIYDSARRAAGSAVTGALAAFSLAFVYQIIWQAQATLTHSVLSLAAGAATLHALVLTLQRGRLRHFFWLGLAMSAGLLSKYTFALFLLALAVAIASVPEARRAFRRPATLVVLGIVAVCVTPHALWAVNNLGVVTQRLVRLEEASLFSRLGLGFGGFAGLLSFSWAAAAIVVPIAGARAIALALTGSAERIALFSGGDTLRAVCGRALLGTVALCSVAVLVGGVRSIPERYVVLLFLPFPLWLALDVALVNRPRAALYFLRGASLIAIGCTLLVATRPLFAAHPYSYPYAGFAHALRAWQAPPYDLLGFRREVAANLAIRMRDTHLFSEERAARRVVMLWNPETEGEASVVPGPLAIGYRAVGEPQEFRQPYRYFSGRTARLRAQLWARD
jgi:4-amino-4-deoxy-L-arabinose transferase-like glycosyltransferase